MATHDEGMEKGIERVGTLIRQLRLARGWTLDELAARVGCVKGYLSAVERGLRPPPMRAISERLEHELGVPAGMFTRAAALARTPPEVLRELELARATASGSPHWAMQEEQMSQERKL